MMRPERSLKVALERSAPKTMFGSDERAAIDRLIDLLDRMPLAIELASARLRLMPPSAIVARISERFELLVATKGRVGRQAALRTTFDWSWDLLDMPERAALAQLSVFAGGFTLDALEAVLSLPGQSAGPMDLLQSLVEKSWVRSLGGRFDLFESVREYAYERLRARRRSIRVVSFRAGSIARTSGVLPDSELAQAVREASRQLALLRASLA